MKIAVVGGGIFGVTIAWMLAKEKQSVDLYEKNKDILSAASGINQYRLHRGYHYPRSEETTFFALAGEPSFRREYKDALIEQAEHYYCIAKEKTLTTAEQCLKTWKKLGLVHEKKELPIINSDKIEVSVKVKESLIDPAKLKEVCWEKLKENKVNVLLNHEATEEIIPKYDLVILATYSQNNQFLGKFPHAKKKYQFELCEKPVLKLPDSFKDKSVVVLDGPFMCIDPFGSTGLFVMGHVEHCIHNRNIGELPQIPPEYKELLNKGVIKNPPITHIKEFLEAAEEFFPQIKEAEHVGSMFTIRTVLPYREKDDARPTILEKINNNVFAVFSGKLGTAVHVAEEVVALVKEMKEIENVSME